MELQLPYFVVLIVTLWNLHLTNAAGCDSSPCQNGGVCFDQPDNGFFCLCVQGFTGLTCVGDVPTTPPPVESTTLRQTTAQATTLPVITSKASTTNVITAQSSSTTEPRQTMVKVTSEPTSTEGVSSGISKDPSTDQVHPTKSATNTEEGAVTSSSITSKMMSTNLKPTNDQSKQGAKNPPAKGSVDDKQGSLLWLLILVLIVLLLIGGVVTIWAVKRSAKNHGAYSPNSVSVENAATMQGVNNGNFQGSSIGYNSNIPTGAD